MFLNESECEKVRQRRPKWRVLTIIWAPSGSEASPAFVSISWADNNVIMTSFRRAPVSRRSTATVTWQCRNEMPDLEQYRLPGKGE